MGKTGSISLAGEYTGKKLEKAACIFFPFLGYAKKKA